MWIEWKLALRFLREGKAQSSLILVGIAVGVAVLVFLSALIAGLQNNIIERTLGTQAHIKIEPAQERNLIVPPPPGSVQLVLEDQRAQRLQTPAARAAQVIVGVHVHSGSCSISR